MNGQLKLNDLLKLSPEELRNTKVRLNTSNEKGINPIDEYKKDQKKLLTWNYWNNKSYRPGQISIGLANMGNSKWLLFTVGKIINLLDTPVRESGEPSTDGAGVGVEYETLPEYECLYGRVIVKYENRSQQMFRNADSIIDDLTVEELLPAPFRGFEFPGYDRICLSFEELATIVNGDYPGYRNALMNQKAVYILTDKSNGKLYVGSATAQNGMLLTRWSNYVSNGHGGNVELKKLVEEKGFDYIKKNFQYSIIENYNSIIDDSHVLKLESYWKDVLQTRNFGYNKN